MKKVEEAVQAADLRNAELIREMEQRQINKLDTIQHSI
jgi:hypothetical protein